MRRYIAILVTVLFVFSITVTDYSSAEEYSPSSNHELNYSTKAIDSLNYLNDIREKMGLQQLKLNPYLTKAAENHAKYLVANNETGHNQKEGNKYFTSISHPGRIEAAGGGIGNNTSEIISYSTNDPAEIIDGFLDTAFHRAPLTNYEAYEFGLGLVDNTAVILIGDKDIESNQLVVYPYDGQTDVGIGFYGNENPNPLKFFDIEKSGYIISFQDNVTALFTNVTITDSKGGKLPFYQGGNSFLYPAYELAYDEVYTVSIDYVANRLKQNKTWSFRTKKAPPIINSRHNVGIKINGKMIPLLNWPPFMKNETVFVPLEGVFDRLNAKIIWNNKTRSITITKQNIKVSLTIGSKIAYVNGKKKTLSEAPYIQGSTKFVPLQFISESIGAKFRWDKKNNIASVDADLGKPIDLMAELFAKPKGKMESKVNPVMKIAQKYGYTLEAENLEPDFTYSSYDVLDKNGDRIVEFVAQVNDWNLAATASIYMRKLSVPQTDPDTFQFIQEIVENFSGVKAENLGSTLFQALGKKPEVSDIYGSFDGFVKLDPKIRYQLNGNYPETWDLTIQLKS